MKIIAASGARLNNADLSSVMLSHRDSKRVVLRRCVPLGVMLLLAAGFLLPAAQSVFGNATATGPNRLPAPLQTERMVRPGLEEVADAPANALDNNGGETVVIGPGHTVAAYN